MKTNWDKYSKIATVIVAVPTMAAFAFHLIAVWQVPKDLADFKSDVDKRLDRIDNRLAISDHGYTTNRPMATTTTQDYN